MARLAKIEGQVRGIHKMFDTDKDAEQILMQVRAVRSAMTSLNSLILKHYVRQQFEVEHGGTPDNGECESLERTLHVLSNYIDG